MRELSKKGAVSSRGVESQEGSCRPGFCMNHLEHVQCIRANFGRDRAQTVGVHNEQTDRQTLLAYIYRLIIIYIRP